MEATIHHSTTRSSLNGQRVDKHEVVDLHAEPDEAQPIRGSAQRSRSDARSEFVIDTETGLKRLRYGDELPRKEKHSWSQPWEAYRERRAELDSWTLQVPDPQTREDHGMPLKRQFAALLGRIGGWTIGEVVASIRTSQKHEQLTGDEAYALIDEALTQYVEDFSFQSPEYQQVRAAFDEHAQAHGYYDHHEVQEAQRDAEALAYMQLPEVQEFVQALDRSYDLFQARLAEECGETMMAHLLLTAREAHELIVNAGKQKLLREGMLPRLYV